MRNCQERLSSLFVFLGQRLIFVGCLIMLDALGCCWGLWCSVLDVMLSVVAVLQHLWLECLSKLSILVMHFYIAVFLCLIPEHCHILLYPTHPEDILLPLHFGRSTCDCPPAWCHYCRCLPCASLVIRSSMHLSCHWNTADFMVVYTQCHTWADRNLHQYHCGNLKSQSTLSYG